MVIHFFLFSLFLLFWQLTKSKCDATSPRPSGASAFRPTIEFTTFGALLNTNAPKRATNPTVNSKRHDDKRVRTAEPAASTDE